MNEPEKWSQQEEVLKSLSDEVAGMSHMQADLESKHWWSNEFFQFMQEPDYHHELARMRKESEALDDDLLAVLVGDMVTEEALPNYSARLATMFPDRTGVGADPWSVWQRGWTAEEDQHGAALHSYLLLTGRVDMISVSRTIYSLIRNGFQQEASPYKGIFYPMFQEPATQLSHTNVAKLAWKKGVKTCTEICAKIASDEKRHAKFYMEISKSIFLKDPEQALLEYSSLMTEGILMPAELMDDGQRGTPDLFNDFAAVATRLGVYTAFDYANILEDMNDALQIGNIRITGEAERSQEVLCKLPGRIRRVAERRKAQKAHHFQFAWIHG